jgi:hypothetical protein
MLFYYTNGDWWMGLSDGSKLTWHNAGNTSGYGNLLDGGHLFFDGDFTGDGKADVLFLATDGNWWMGVSDGTKLNWHLAASSSAFGNLVEGSSHRIVTGDFDGDGKSDVLFYYNGDGNWWLGKSDGNTLTWSAAAIGHSSGDLLDWSHRLFPGDWTGDGKLDVASYDSDDGSFTVGASSGATLGWQTPANQAGLGNLVDRTRLVFSGDFDGDHKLDLLTYDSSDGGWRIGKGDGQKLTWRDAGNTKGFGDLTH